MIFNPQPPLVGKHALLGASKYHWLKSDDAKIIGLYDAAKAIAMGTRLHAFAAECISLRQKLPKQKKTLNLYVNDAIGYIMQPEQILYYSDNCFGCADAISFRNNMLRIHDLKTGEVPAHMEQLEIYASLFCLEYGFKPSEIEMELRIYQNDEVAVHNPEVDRIRFIMDRIVAADKLLSERKSEE